jgi:hypothetical protein
MWPVLTWQYLLLVYVCLPPSLEEMLRVLEKRGCVPFRGYHSCNVLVTQERYSTVNLRPQAECFHVFKAEVGLWTVGPCSSLHQYREAAKNSQRMRVLKWMFYAKTGKVDS